ncbi:MAG: CRISPR-associated endonuclease/helicase Cas3 [Desulfovibrio sp.]
MQKYTFWAKTYASKYPGISVVQHGKFASAVGRKLVRIMFPEQWQHLQPAIAFLLLTHDAGKISPQFQARCPLWLEQNGLHQEAVNNSWATIGAPHARLSQEILDCFWQQKGLLSESYSLWSAIVGAHHGKWAKARPQCYGRASPPCMAPSPSISWLQEGLQFVAGQWEQCGLGNEPHCNAELPPVTAESASLYASAGLITLADWIASDERHFPADPALAPASDEHIAQVAHDVVDALGLAPLKIRSGLSFEDIFGCSPYPMQKAAWENIVEPGVYVIEAPMGMGKTEAALMAAYRLMELGKARGVYFGLPTQATSNRIHERVLAFVRQVSPSVQSVQLIHGNSWLLDDILAAPELEQKLPDNSKAGSGADPLRWFCSSRRALLAPVGVGTADQAMLAALAVKHFALRRLALMGKVVILDEVHSYDHYTRAIIQKLCQVLADLGATVIILSATLTGSARAALLQSCGPVPSMDAEEDSLPYPCISGRAHGQDAVQLTPCAPPPSRTVHVDFQPLPSAISHAVRIAATGAQVLWVCNTVPNAQDAFREIQRQASGAGHQIDMGILHARLPFFMREERETEWMRRLGKAGERQRGCILVSTQIVEQSVDLDADALFTELAPTDMLLQRMGRLWRHARRHRPVSQPFMHVVAEGFPLENLPNMSAEAIRAGLGTKARVYDPFILLRTLDVWGGIASVTLPDDIRRLIHETYTEPEIMSEAMQKLYDEQFGRNAAMKMQAGINTDIWRLAGTDIEEYAKTRLSDHLEYGFVMYRENKNNNITLLDGSVVSADSKELVRDTARKLHRNAVKIPGYRLIEHPEESSFLHTYNLLHWIRLGDDGNLIVHGLKGGEQPLWDTDTGIVWPKQREQP